MSDIPRNELDPLNRALEAYTLFLQGVFASEVIPDKWRWSADARTKITITGEYPVDASKSEGRPALVLAPNGAQFLGLGISDHVDRGGLAGLDDTPVETDDLLESAVAVQCLARSSGVAIAIGWRAMHSLRQHTRLLARYARLHTMDARITMSRPLPAGEYITGVPSTETWSRVVILSRFQAGEASEATADESGAFQVVHESATISLESRFGPLPAQDVNDIDPLGRMCGSGDVSENPLAYRGVPVRVSRPQDPLAAARRSRTMFHVTPQSGETR